MSLKYKVTVHIDPGFNSSEKPKKVSTHLNGFDILTEKTIDKTIEHNLHCTF